MFGTEGTSWEFRVLVITCILLLNYKLPKCDVNNTRFVGQEVCTVENRVLLSRLEILICFCNHGLLCRISSSEDCIRGKVIKIFCVLGFSNLLPHLSVICFFSTQF